MSSQPPPAHTRRGSCLEIKPAPIGSARDAIPVRPAPEPLPVIGDGFVEMQEREILKKSRGWKNVTGLKGYSKNGTYPDLYVYFDAKSKGKVNHFALRTFSAYAQDMAANQVRTIRGDVVVIKGESPCSITHYDYTGDGPGCTKKVMSPPLGDVTLDVEEMRTTLLWWADHCASEAAKQRDYARTMSAYVSGSL